MGCLAVDPDVAACAAAVIADLGKRGQVAQTKATVTLPKWNDRGQTSVALPSSGQSRLTDGTVIVVAGEQDMLGDPIRQTLVIDGHNVAVNVLGIVAVRWLPAGSRRAHGPRSVARRERRLAWRAAGR